MALVTVQRSPTPSTSSSPCVSESGSGEDDRRSQPRSIGESFLTVKGAALFLPRGNGSSAASRFSQLRSKHAGDLQQHLQTMFTLLRPEDNIKLAVRLESAHSQVTRYMVVVSTNGRQDTEESLVLGMDFSPTDSSCSVGMVLPLWSDTLIHLDGDGGFSVSTDSRVHIFKPVSVQAMWSALQSLHKACEVARSHNYFPGSLFLTWVSYYQSRVGSDQVRINEWNAMRDVQSHRADSPNLFTDIPTERARTERLIKTSLREIMMQKDLENVTSKEIRTELEMHMTCNLREFKEFIDNEMIVILGQMDSPTEIFEHVYLGSEWNASNLEELQNSGVQYILNVTREIDNFFPGLFEYHNIRVYDEEATDLLAYWNDTYKFISRAKKAGGKCLVHCKMGVSRSASTVIAYAMKEYGWELERAFDHVKERRAVTKPNPSFMRQLEEYQGILLASKQRHNKLWRSHSDSDLSEHHEPLTKPTPQPQSLGRADPRNQAALAAAPTLQELLRPLGGSSGAGRGSQSASLPDTGVQLHAHPAPTPDPTPSVAQLQSELSRLRAPSPHSGSTPPASALPLSNGLCDSEEDPAPTPPLLPQPQAATVVPEAHRTGTATVTEGVLAAGPHPPPSLHHLPASFSPLTPPTHSVPPLTPQDPDTKPDCDPPPLCGLPVDSPTPCPPSAAVEEGKDGTPAPQDQQGALSSSADHISFFSAREKFQGLSQDGRTQGQTKALPLPPQEEEGRMKEEERRKDVVAPLQVTGLKPTLGEAVALPLAALCQSGSVQDPARPKQEVEQKKEEEAADEEPAPLCRDWTRGSVRRVTQQLEQRLKQEHDSPPPPGPPAAPPPSSARPQCTPHSTEVGGALPLVGPAPDAQNELIRWRTPDNGDDLVTCCPMEEGADVAPRLSPSAAATSPSMDFLCLEGVTEQESGTEQDGPAEAEPLPVDDIINARETWATLRELGAFLRQATLDWDQYLDWDPGSPMRRRRGGGLHGVQQRVREAEARIRRAGLTPPSLMKRSASLAKLGRLDLLVDDLSDWELGGRAAEPLPLSRPAAAAMATEEESKKKQRVHGSGSAPSAGPPDMSLVCGPSPSPSPPPLPNQQDADAAHPPPLLSPELVSMATRQQYGRTHPLRRLKRRTASTLYHTM